MDQPRFAGADLVWNVDYIVLLFGFSFVLGSGLNLLVWGLCGCRPRFGFPVCWVVAGELLVAQSFGWGLMVLVMAITLVMFWAVGEATFHHMADQADDINDVVHPGTVVVDAMKLPGGLRWTPVALDRLPHDRRVVVCLFVRPVLAWRLRRRGFGQRWVTCDRLAAWPVWVREAAAEPDLEPMSAR